MMDLLNRPDPHVFQGEVIPDAAINIIRDTHEVINLLATALAVPQPGEGQPHQRLHDILFAILSKGIMQ